MSVSAEPIRILLVEDLPADAELTQHEINQTLQSVILQRVETQEDYLTALAVFQPDLIISDYHLPHFDGLKVLRLAQERLPFTPVIILTGALNEDTAVECMKAGAADYVIKEHLKRLGQAVLHVLEEKQVNWERRQAEAALQESEERYRTLVYTLPDAITVTDVAGNITFVSPVTLHFYGHENEAEVLGHNILEWVDVSQYEQAVTAIQTVLAGGLIRNQEYLLRKKDGSLLFGEVSASCLSDAHHQPISIIIVTRDITIRKKAEEARIKLEEQLRQAQKMESVGRLAGGIAHDFNNLLTVIQGHSMMMRDQVPAEDPLREPLQAILHASQRAAALTRQLLAFSRKQIMAPSRLDLNTVVTNLRTMLEQLIGEDISLSTVLQSDLWPVTADPGQLEQVIANLAVNARDAMPTGGLLTIETRSVYVEAQRAKVYPDLPTGPYTLLSVSDNGYGMDENIRAHLFEPFFTTKEVGKGTGLGLAMVYGIVKQSGGDITVYSELEQGTTFKIYLPAYPDSTTNEVSPQVQPLIQGGNETILLVEDDESVRDLVQEMLQEKGYTILEARQGDEALSLVRQHQGQIDLLLTDVVMPQMGGRKLAEQLKIIQPQVKVLFISGYTDDAVVRHGLLDAEIEFLAKPFLLNDLAAKVREVLDKRA